MSFGRISGHLMSARDLALKHDPTSDWQRIAVEVLVFHLEALLALTRYIHHRRNLGCDDE